MKQYFLTIIKKLYFYLNRPVVALLIVIIPVGVSVSFFNNYEMQNYYPDKIVWLAVFKENNNNLKEQMLLEIELELKKYNLELYLETDTIANEIFIQPKSSVPNWVLNDWCIYIGKQSLNNLVVKKQCNQDIKSFICVKKEVNMY